MTALLWMLTVAWAGPLLSVRPPGPGEVGVDAGDVWIPRGTTVQPRKGELSPDRAGDDLGCGRVVSHQARARPALAKKSVCEPPISAGSASRTGTIVRSVRSEQHTSSTSAPSMPLHYEARPGVAWRFRSRGSSTRMRRPRSGLRSRFGATISGRGPPSLKGHDETASPCTPTSWAPMRPAPIDGEPRLCHGASLTAERLVDPLCGDLARSDFVRLAAQLHRPTRRSGLVQRCASGSAGSQDTLRRKLRGHSSLSRRRIPV